MENLTPWLAAFNSISGFSGVKKEVKDVSGISGWIGSENQSWNSSGYETTLTGLTPLTPLTLPPPPDSSTLLTLSAVTPPFSPSNDFKTFQEALGFHREISGGSATWSTLAEGGEPPLTCGGSLSHIEVNSTQSLQLNKCNYVGCEVDHIGISTSSPPVVHITHPIKFGGKMKKKLHKRYDPLADIIDETIRKNDSSNICISI